MPVELRILALRRAAAVRAHLHRDRASRRAQYGRKWNVGARDEALPPANPMTGRTMRAHQANFRRPSRSRSSRCWAWCMRRPDQRRGPPRRLDLARRAAGLSAALCGRSAGGPDDRLDDQHGRASRWCCGRCCLVEFQASPNSAGRRAGTRAPRKWLRAWRTGSRAPSRSSRSMRLASVMSTLLGQLSQRSSRRSCSSSSSIDERWRIRSCLPGLHASARLPRILRAMHEASGVTASQPATENAGIDDGTDCHCDAIAVSDRRPMTRLRSCSASKKPGDCVQPVGVVPTTNGSPRRTVSTIARSRFSNSLLKQNCD